MKKVLVVGSGPSGVHFSLSLLRMGYDVIMIDVGNKKSKIISPDDTFAQLKMNLADPVKYFLGEHYAGVVYPDGEGEYYGFPPSKDYIFAKPTTFDLEASGFEPLFSFAQGGLAEAWTGGVYPFNDDELQDFPFAYGDIEPHYNEVSQRIGIAAAQDDLVKFFPWHDNLLGPLQLDTHSQQILLAYEKHKHYIRDKLKCHVGRSRIATLSTGKDNRLGCSYCGRCLWGCPSAALYTPLITLQQIFQYENFQYIPNMFASHFTYDASHHIKSLVAKSVVEEQPYEFFADTFVLAAGTLSSSQIFMESIRQATGKVIKLKGLMDNRQLLIPFVNFSMFGKSFSLESYQYHQIAMGVEVDEPSEYIHGQITTLKSAMTHPIISGLPFDLRTAIELFRNLRSALGVININLHDTRRDNNYLTLDVDSKSDRIKIVIRYTPDGDEAEKIKQVTKKVKKFLRKLGCVVPPGMSHIRPMGASVHYSGTIPMSSHPAPSTTSKYCRSHDFDNLYIVDGSTFPFLPAKNLTFTLMANAVRVAEHAF